jgi:hypothetical protein
MADRKPIIFDETAFVYLMRNSSDFTMKSELTRLLYKCQKHHNEREYDAYSTRTIKKKLGYGWLYHGWKWTFVRHQTKRRHYENQLERREFSEEIIVRFLRPHQLRTWPKSWILMDLYLFANENKRERIGRPLTPQEVIPLDMCETALIAHETGYPIFSFNEDYEYFIKLPGIKTAYLQYWKPSDILSNLPL